ncbi:MAG TPA: indolepyruvate oxidoreductase subunit beta [Bacteroidales bacterium]|nr:indolepyruvate oxidoreductase subunit beta [Bacteroidales bacterium]
MNNDIIIAGVGGQGILSIASTIGYAAIESGLIIKQSEVHGMSQRGGDVQSHLRISDKEIASDLIPKGKADLIISVEPMEGLRYLPFLSKSGWLVTNTKPFVNIAKYPDEKKLIEEIKSLEKQVTLNADQIAAELGSVKAANMVILGAASPFIKVEFELLENAIRVIFGPKGGETVNMNLKALHAGRNFTRKLINK